MVLKNCSDINEGNWLQLLFHFFLLMGIVSWDIGMSFFLLCFSFLIEVFSFCTFTETFAIGLQNWFDHKRIDFEVFPCNVAFFVEFWSAWTEICKNCTNFFPFRRRQIFSIVSLRGILVCSLKMFVLFSRWILQYRLITYSNAMQRWFLSFLRHPVHFDRNLWLSISLIPSEIQLVRFQSFVVTVFWDSYSYTVEIVFWMKLMEPVDKPARWWPWSCLIFVYGLRRLHKTWSLWDAYISLTRCSKIVPT